MQQGRHIGISLGRVGQWNDGIGEFTRRFAMAVAQRAAALREREGWRISLQLPRRWHGLFGGEVHYLDVEPSHRWLHHCPGVDLWHNLHLRSRVAPPLQARCRVETLHDLIFLDTARNPAQARLRRWTAWRRLQGSTQVVAISHHVAGQLRQHMPGLRTPVAVIHNGVADSADAPRQAVSSLENRPFLLHISRLSANKNVPALLDLAAAWPEQTLVLAGQRNPQALAVGEQLRQRGLHNVTQLFDIDDATKHWLYASCQGFVFPSLDEGFGLPPIEALYFGKPVFLSRLTALPEVGGDVACYFDSFEPAAMRAVVQAGLAAVQQPGAVQALQAHARQFSWDRCIDAHLALYRQLLGQTAAGTQAAALVQQP